MRKQIHIVQLDEAQRAQLKALINQGKASKEKLNRSRILLKADKGPYGPGWIDEKIADYLAICPNTIVKLRKKFVKKGFEETMNRKIRTTKTPPKLDGKAEAALIALACSEAPEGHSRWSLHLLTDKMVALYLEKPVSRETIRKTLKKTSLNRGSLKNGVYRVSETGFS